MPVGGGQSRLGTGVEALGHAHRGVAPVESSRTATPFDYG